MRSIADGYSLQILVTRNLPVLLNAYLIPRLTTEQVLVTSTCSAKYSNSSSAAQETSRRRRLLYEYEAVHHHNGSELVADTEWLGARSVQLYALQQVEVIAVVVDVYPRAGS